MDSLDAIANRLVGEIESFDFITNHNDELNTSKLMCVLRRIPRKTGGLRGRIAEVDRMRVEKIHHESITELPKNQKVRIQSTPFSVKLVRNTQGPRLAIGITKPTNHILPPKLFFENLGLPSIELGGVKRA